MDRETTDLLKIAVPVGVAALAFVWHFLRNAEAADDADAVFEALRGAGYTIERDGRSWINSRLPRVDLHQNVPRRRHRRARNVAVPLQMAHREDAQSHVIAFLLPESVTRTHDRFVVAVDPKNRGVLAMPAEEELARLAAETGWTCEAHGVWLVLFRTNRVALAGAEAPGIVDEALAIARRVLGAGVR